MSFFGCLGLMLLCALLFVIAVAGRILSTICTFLSTICTFLTGGFRRPQGAQRSTQRQQEAAQKPTAETAGGDYVFKPSDGEYIEFEEV